jgi:pSer/pThr/pTyr-binding forkhead associated (FHA) protein
VRSRTNAAVTPVSGQRMTETAIRSSDVIIEVNGMRHPLTPPGLVVGRGNNADLRIDDPGISRRNAQISLKEAEGGTIVTVTDLGSTNGVLLNGHKVDTAQVSDGSEIRLGNTVIIIRITPSGGGS